MLFWIEILIKKAKIQFIVPKKVKVQIIIKMEVEPIFSDNLLSVHLANFNLSNISNIRRIRIWIKELVQELESGKLQSLKEEEIKSRFLTRFFGDILGFNCEDSREWLLREEKKSITNGKKCDAALGYFFADKSKDDVRAVIEIKYALSNLDANQGRVGNTLTPVEQAFGYASDMQGNCKWVIVSNIQEIRFYYSLRKSQYQRFYLKELLNEEKLRELLFLFHKDRFIKKGIEKSFTDNLFENAKRNRQQAEAPSHIIDKLYYSLQRFKGLSFIDPNFIATIYPFNILDEHVWQYSKGHLFTLNPEIYELLKSINIDNGKVIFSEELQLSIVTLDITEAQNKIEWIFSFLNYCLINRISAIKDYKKIAERERNVIGFTYSHFFRFKEGSDGITKNIYIPRKLSCDCLICNYQNLDFSKLLSKLKIAEGNDNFNNSEYAYGNYLIASNNYKTTYNIYKKNENEIKGKEDKAIEYFLIKKNILLLHNLVSDYDLADKQEIMNDIKSTDLDRIIHNDIEFYIDKDVRKYLLDFKEDVLIDKIRDEINKIVVEIERVKDLYDNGGQRNGEDLAFGLSYQYYIVYNHINLNFIIYDVFTPYEDLVIKVFKGLIIHSQIPNIGKNLLDIFFLTEAILHIQPGSFESIVLNTSNIKVKIGTTEKLLEKLSNFTISTFEDKYSFEPYKNQLLSEYLNNYTFSRKFANIFTNLFILLLRLDISNEQFLKCKKPLINFLKVYSKSSWLELKKFSKFILAKGKLFDESELIEILKIAIDGDKYGYHTFNELIEEIPQALSKFYPEYKLSNIKIIQMAIFNCSSDDGERIDYKHLVYLVNITNDSCRKFLLDAFEKELDRNFNYHFYETLIHNSNYYYNTKNYFQVYAEEVNKNKFRGEHLSDSYFIRFIFNVYKFQIDFNRPELHVFTNLSDFEIWLLNPIEFDYEKFDSKWLLEVNKPFILNRLKGNEHISTAVEIELRRCFNSKLAEIKYAYF